MIKRPDQLFIPRDPRLLRKIENQMIWNEFISQTFATATIPVKHTILAGREAWQRIKSSPRKRQNYRDWQTLIDAYALGEQMCERVAGRRQGGKYNRLLSAWLKQNEFDDIPSSTRTYMRNVGENQGEIEIWRHQLPPEARMSFNNPRTVWEHYDRWRKSGGHNAE